MGKGVFQRAIGLVVSSGLPGLGWLLAAGLALLRGNVAVMLGGKLPRAIFLWRGAHWGGIQHVSLGKFIRVGRWARMQAWPGGEFRIGNHFSLGDCAVIENGFGINGQRGSIVIGDNVGIGAFSFISSPSRVEIGNDCIIGQYLSIHAQNHRFDGSGLIRLQGTTENGVKVGNNCWLGAKVTILDGVTVGDGSVIAAGAVVTRDFGPGSVIGGCPARLIKTIAPGDAGLADAHLPDPVSPH